MKRRTWREEIYDAFVALGGDAQYKDLYEYLERNVPRYHESKNVKATIRAEIERASSDSDVFNGKEDLKKNMGIYFVKLVDFLFLIHIKLISLMTSLRYIIWLQFQNYVLILRLKYQTW